MAVYILVRLTYDFSLKIKKMSFHLKNFKNHPNLNQSSKKSAVNTCYLHLGLPVLPHLFYHALSPLKKNKGILHNSYQIDHSWRSLALLQYYLVHIQIFPVVLIMSFKMYFLLFSQFPNPGLHLVVFISFHEEQFLIHFFPVHDVDILEQSGLVVFADFGLDLWCGFCVIRFGFSPFGGSVTQMQCLFSVHRIRCPPPPLARKITETLLGTFTFTLTQCFVFVFLILGCAKQLVEAEV